MGLDQYAYVKTAETGEEGGSAKFTWRKHSKLQTFMETLYTERTGLSAADLNCGELKLESADIDTLEQAVKGSALPHCEGGGSARSSLNWSPGPIPGRHSLYGHQFQGEVAAESRDYDLEFCAWARAEIARGSTVIYSCWW